MKDTDISDEVWRNISGLGPAGLSLPVPRHQGLDDRPQPGVASQVWPGGAAQLFTAGRVLHSHWSRNIQIFCSDWWNTMLTRWSMS